MHRRSSKLDDAQNAPRVVEQAIGAPLAPKKRVLRFPERKKNAAAVALGGFKGGHARAAKLTAERRKEIAQRAAKERWAKRERWLEWAVCNSPR